MFTRIRKHFSFNYDQNVVELFKPLYTLLSLTGLFPYSIRFPKGKHDCNITRGTFLLHSVCGVLVFAYICTFFALRLKYATTTAEGGLTDVNFIIEIFFVFICSATVYLCAFRYGKLQVGSLSRIATTWTALSKKSDSGVDPILAYLRKFFIATAMFGLLTVIPVQIYIITISHETVWEYLFIHLLEAVPTLVVAFYSTLVLMVLGLLKIVKNHCQSIDETKTTYDCNIANTTRFKENDWIFLNKLETAYVNAMEVKQEINRIFQAPITIIIAQCFHMTLSESHTLYHEVLVVGSFDTYIIIDRIFWVLYSLMKVFVLTYTGSLLQDEVGQIGQVLHSLPIEKQDLNLLMEIQHFSTLLSFHGANISIYGYFTLDSTLLFNMVAALATYLIILVQFDT